MDDDLVWGTTTNPHPDFTQGDRNQDFEEMLRRERQLDRFWKGLMAGNFSPGEVSKTLDMLAEDGIEPRDYLDMVADKLITSLVMSSSSTTMAAH
ncbi:MAG: hypothetical protein BRC46_00705 [Cyanobacteria bacterium QS_6_48_18]|nr:MAG: hypothetical protein BRC46_00705 [Cyanobacteria bacterium QS_6_48_18]